MCVGVCIYQWLMLILWWIIRFHICDFRKSILLDSRFKHFSSTCFHFVWNFHSLCFGLSFSPFFHQSCLQFSYEKIYYSEMWWRVQWQQRNLIQTNFIINIKRDAARQWRRWLIWHDWRVILLDGDDKINSVWYLFSKINTVLSKNLENNTLCRPNKSKATNRKSFIFLNWKLVWSWECVVNLWCAVDLKPKLFNGKLTLNASGNSIQSKLRDVLVQFSSYSGQFFIFITQCIGVHNSSWTLPLASMWCVKEAI